MMCIQLLVACQREGLFEDVIKFVSENVASVYNLSSKQPLATSTSAHVSDGTTIIEDTLNNLATIVSDLSLKEVYNDI